jgi:branched-chain amino acid transport system permease protein
MSVEDRTIAAKTEVKSGLIARIRLAVRGVPLMGWLLGILLAAGIEHLVGYPLARVLGMSNFPPLFGVTFIFSEPLLIPSVLVYNLLMYVIPIGAVALLTAPWINRLSAWLYSYPLWISGLVHLALIYADLALWASISDYRVLVVRLTLVAVLVTLSLNVVNGYMGEFSCSHPGFMALGAYGASILTVLFFTPNNVFGVTLLPAGLAPFIFPITLIAGGLLASFGALFIAIPSFRTRGDYLAIISLAFMFIVKSLIENIQIIGGARGFMGMPSLASLPVVFLWTIIGLLVINNFVRSTLGKALNAVRDDETAADAMTVNTRRTKMVAFLFSAFWAGVAGGLLAHVISYVNPGSFGILKLSEVLAMVYLGGLNSIVGSIVGAVGLNFLMEALRPLDIYKWIVIPTMLILLMIFRPTGLIAFTEFKIEEILKPKSKTVQTEEVEHAAAAD